MKALLTTATVSSAATALLFGTDGVRIMADNPEPLRAVLAAVRFLAALVAALGAVACVVALDRLRRLDAAQAMRGPVPCVVPPMRTPDPPGGNRIAPSQD